MDSKVCLALDGLSRQHAVSLTATLRNRLFAVKIHDLYDAFGARIILDLNMAGSEFRVWTDLKLHDTPDTVGLRTSALIRSGANIITVHAAGGIPMMEASVKAADGMAEIWAITVLTSLDPKEISQIFGADRTAKQVVLDLALMARKAGVNGLVCSAQEVGMLSAHPDLQNVRFVVPGTRLAGTALGQQKRSGTPAQAVADGATLLVVGSQVTKADDSIATFDAFESEVVSALKQYQVA